MPLDEVNELINDQSILPIAVSKANSREGGIDSPNLVESDDCN